MMCVRNKREKNKNNERGDKIYGILIKNTKYTHATRDGTIDDRRPTHAHKKVKSLLKNTACLCRIKRERNKNLAADPRSQ